MLSLLILVSPVVGYIRITTFEQFDLSFDSKCEEFFLFNGTRHYAYLHRHNENIQLWITEGYSNYIVYSSPIPKSKLHFTWKEKLVNNRPMDRIMYEGNFTYPLKFDTEVLLCKITSLVAGNSTFEQPSLPLTYKCESNEKWYAIIATLVIVIVVLVVISVHSNGGFEEIILGPAFPWLLQRIREILSRGEADSSRGYQTPGATTTL